VTTTVYMLGGAFSGTNNYMPQQLQGAITNGNTQIQVPYNNFGMFVSTVQQGAKLLDSYLRAGSGTMVVFGHSLGAVVGSYWIANYASVSGAPTASNLSFVFIGNSVSKYGGALGPETGALWNNWFTTAVNIPAGNSFAIRDIKRQYDGWTDWCTGTPNGNATFNAFSGQGSVHPNYQNVPASPTAAGNYSYTENNITYVWNRTTPVPLYGATWDAVTKPLDQSLRPSIEGAYNRPVTVAAPTY
jgi:hypothetical protein